jgi:hypothetical protein
LALEQKDSVTDQANLHNIATVIEYMSAWKSCLDAKGIMLASQVRPFDLIALSILNKAYRLSEACISLIKEGFSDEAFGLSRSILECAINLRCLTFNLDEIDSRANNFLEFYYADQKHFLELIRKDYPEDERNAAAEAIAQADKLDVRWQNARHPPNDWKEIDPERWNCHKIVTAVHPLDNEMSQHCNILKLHTAIYRGASARVHCSISSLDNFSSDTRFPFKVGERRTICLDHTREPLLAILEGLYLSVGYALYGAKLDQTESFDQLIVDIDTKLVKPRKRK